MQQVLGFLGLEIASATIFSIWMRPELNRGMLLKTGATTHTVSFPQEAVTGDFGELVRLLLDHGGKIFDTRRGQV